MNERWGGYQTRSRLLSAPEKEELKIGLDWMDRDREGKR